MTKKIELLAPAGNYAAFLAAVENGADAVYMGGKLLNARQFAGNFEDEELQNELLDILSGGRRIFRRFKDALAVDREQLDRYYLYIEERNRERVKEWLESIGVKLILE